MDFWRFTRGHAKPATPLRDVRLVNTLRALDGHLSGASYRAIAECLFGSARLDAEPWKSSSVRDATIRTRAQWRSAHARRLSQIPPQIAVGFDCGAASPHSRGGEIRLPIFAIPPAGFSPPK